MGMTPEEMLARLRWRYEGIPEPHRRRKKPAAKPAGEAAAKPAARTRPAAPAKRIPANALSSRGETAAERKKYGVRYKTDAERQAARLACRRRRHKKYVDTHREQRNAYMREYMQRYREANRDKCRQRNRESMRRARARKREAAADVLDIPE